MDANTVLLIGGGLGLLLLVVGFGMTVFGERSVVEERLGRYTEAGQVISTGSAPKDKGEETRFLHHGLLQPHG